jgi:hypothetical protein
MQRRGYVRARLPAALDYGRTASWEQHRLLAPAATANAPTPFRTVIDAAWQALNAKPILNPRTETAEEVL